MWLKWKQEVKKSMSPKISRAYSMLIEFLNRFISETKSRCHISKLPIPEIHSRGCTRHGMINREHIDGKMVQERFHSRWLIIDRGCSDVGENLCWRKFPPTLTSCSPTYQSYSPLINRHSFCQHHGATGAASWWKFSPTIFSPTSFSNIKAL